MSNIHKVFRKIIRLITRKYHASGLCSAARPINGGAQPQGRGELGIIFP